MLEGGAQTVHRLKEPVAPQVWLLLLRQTKIRRDHLLRRPKSRKAAFERHIRFPSAAVASPFKTNTNISSPPGSAKKVSIMSPTSRTVTVDGVTMPVYDIVFDEAKNVGGILAVHGRDVKVGGKVTDKLQLTKPIFDVRDFHLGLYSATLSTTGDGIISTEPSTPLYLRERSNTDHIQALIDGAVKSDGAIDHSKLCQNVLTPFQTLTTEIKDNPELKSFKCFYRMPDGIFLNNECFNTDENGNNPPSLYKVVTKLKVESDTIGEDQAGRHIVSLKPFIVWELGIDGNKDRRTHTVKTDHEKALADAMATLGIKLKPGTGTIATS